MHTPTKTQWQTVIDNFKKVLPLAVQENHLDLMEGAVNQDHQCGTVHCIGGWYAMAICDISKPIDWTHGALVMVDHLGFDRRSDLNNWAEENPDIWGNKCGDSVFTEKAAWNGANSLAEVITFLEGVRDRSPD